MPSTLGGFRDIMSSKVYEIFKFVVEVHICYQYFIEVQLGIKLFQLELLKSRKQTT